MVHAIKDIIHIAGVVDNTKDKYGRPKDGRPKDVRPKRKKPTVRKIIPKDSTLATIYAASYNSGLSY